MDPGRGKIAIKNTIRQTKKIGIQMVYQIKVLCSCKFMKLIIVLKLYEISILSKNKPKYLVTMYVTYVQIVQKKNYRRRENEC